MSGLTEGHDLGHVFLPAFPCEILMVNPLENNQAGILYCIQGAQHQLRRADGVCGAAQHQKRDADLAHGFDQFLLCLTVWKRLFGV